MSMRRIFALRPALTIPNEAIVPLIRQEECWWQYQSVTSRRCPSRRSEARRHLRRGDGEGALAFLGGGSVPAAATATPADRKTVAAFRGWITDLEAFGFVNDARVVCVLPDVTLDPTFGGVANGQQAGTPTGMAMLSNFKGLHLLPQLGTRGNDRLFGGPSSPDRVYGRRGSA